ncbi:hypothetical protein J2X32_001292 [Rheinheimera pacifica]|uniref:hypothetical protein n=1 Tax=Rheinheimera pacifica TaxID=173990 RepID=UPI00285CF109|nr:hypothetical protein [Rheinheimera pacifica]MDR6982674.1 hypothetical protein [Rheinheimera pacifica]
MTEEKIKSIVHRYRKKSAACLLVFLGFAIFANWFLVNSNIDRNFEIGLEYTSGDLGYIWGAVIFGLNIVLLLFFYSLEKILLCLYQENSD